MLVSNFNFSVIFSLLTIYCPIGNGIELLISKVCSLAVGSIGLIVVMVFCNEVSVVVFTLRFVVPSSKEQA